MFAEAHIANPKHAFPNRAARTRGGTQHLSRTRTRSHTRTRTCTHNNGLIPVPMTTIHTTYYSDKFGYKVKIRAHLDEV